MTQRLVFVDVLRFVAIALVLCYHLDLALFQGGNLGVDIFFVISGFVVFRSFSKAFADNVDLKYLVYDFYKNRILRLLPALVVMLTIVTLHALLLLAENDLSVFYQTLAASSFGLNNILFIITARDYFSSDLSFQPLTHLWSLGVEQQYYLAFPFIALMILIKKHKIWVITLFLVIASYYIWREWYFSNQINWFYNTLSRLWQFQAGIFSCLMRDALMRQRKLPRFPFFYNFISYSSIGIIFFNILFLNDFFDKRALAELTCLLVVVCLTFFREFSFEKSFTVTNILAYLGKCSYSIYLYHWPIIVFYKQYFLTPILSEDIILLCILSLLAGILSYELIERRIARYFKSVTLVGASVAFSIGLFVFGSISYVKIKSLNSIDSLIVEELREVFYPGTSFNFNCFTSDMNYTEAAFSDCISISSTETNILLIGDSFAGALHPLFQRFTEEHNYNLSVVASSYCYPSFGNGMTPELYPYRNVCDNNRQHLRSFEEFDAIIVAAFDSYLFSYGLMQDYIDAIDILAEDRTVIVIGSPLQFTVNNRSMLSRFLHSNAMIGDVIDFVDTEALVVNEHLENAIRLLNNEKILFINVSEEQFEMLNEEPENILFLKNSSDGKHLSVYGNIRLYNRFQESDMLSTINDHISRSGLR